MPKHVFEKVEDPLKFRFDPPVSLGPYVLKDYDKAGYWWFFERREDWQRTSVGMVYGKPKPKYVLFIWYGTDEKKEWLKSFEIDVPGYGKFKPFDDTIPQRIADWAIRRGYKINMKPEEIWGIGWWKYAPDIAEKLLISVGFKKRDGKWYLPNGEPWKITITRNRLSSSPRATGRFSLACHSPLS